MRNLKKILAMVLALVMSLSLMATAGAADFTDASSINEKYETAIEVLEGLGVFKGYQDGTFQPQGSITRAETAAIIYRIVTGDVKDEQVGIYADYNLFTDVPSTSWFAGYVNYCANAEYIKGVGGGKFNPNAQVTGYAALAMILRAIGYTANGGFTGSDWEVQTARTAEARKITKNILTGTLGQDANRETVAEILFQAILVNMVDHNVDNTFNGDQGYFEKDITLGYKTFKLEQVEGVVTANEFADLYSNQVLNEGLTNLEVAEDDIRSLAITTEITDIGESRYAYITGSKVLAMGDTGNNKVTEFGHACDITTTSKFNAVAEMSAASGIEYYVDFDRSGYWTSDFRIEYVITFANEYGGYKDAAAYNEAAQFADDALVYWRNDGKTLNRVIPAGQVITLTDYDNMRNIFTWSNGVWDKDTDKFQNGFEIGQVYVATQTKEDISDKISFNQFVEDYLNDKTFNDNWGVSYNGQWVKFVDNNGDGQAEYAFKTNSWLDEALETYTNKDGETVTVFNWFDDNDDPRSIDGDYQVRYMNGETPAVGDKVICAWIDNQILVEPANDVTKTVKSYSWRDDEITCTDDEKLGQSGIGNATDMLQLIATMADKTEYVMYLDHFGYVRAYEWPGATDYVLVTEIYARNNANGNLVRDWPMTVELKNKDEKPAEYSLNGGSGNLFVTSSHKNPQAAWSLISNYAAVGDYYNWLQPATAHMGVGAADYAPNYGVGTLTDNTYMYWPTNRQAVRQITALTANDTFDYGAKTYKGINGVDLKNEGTVSFTNIAIANIDGDNATLQGAARLKLDRDGRVMFYNDGTNTRARYAVDYVQLSTDLPVAAGAVRYPIGGTPAYATANNDYVNAVHDTQYYIVHDNGVEYFTDFTNMPALTADNVGEIHAAYAVAKDISSDNAGAPYWVADVIVFEVQNWSNDKAGSVSLAYYTPSRTTGNVQNIDTINAKYGLTSLIPGNKAWSADQWQWGANWDGYGFYKLTNETEPVDNVMTASKIDRIENNSANDRNYGKNNIHAGIVTREAYLAGNGYYIDVDMSYASAQPWLGARAVTQRVIASIEITDKIYSVTTDDTHQGYWYDYNEAELLRYKNANNSQVKEGDLIVWVGEAKSSAVDASGILSATNFVVDLGNPVNNADLFNKTASFLLRQDVSWQGEWIDIMEEQNTAAPTVVPVVTFFGQDSAWNGVNITATATFNQATANNKAGADVSVEGGKLVMWEGANVTSSTSFDLPVLEGGKTYNGTVLSDDGRYYTVTLVQEPKTIIPAEMEVYSTNPAIAVVKPNDGPTDIPASVDWRWITYRITINDPEQLTINSLQNILTASAGCKVVDLKAYDQTLTLDNYGTPISKNQTCATAMWFEVTVEKNGTQKSVLMFRNQTDTIPGGTTFTVSIPNYATSGIKAYWVWPGTPVESSAIKMNGTTAEIQVVNGQGIEFAVSGLTAEPAASDWSVTGGAGKMVYWHPEENNSSVMRILVNGAAISGISFTDPNAPAPLADRVATALADPTFVVVLSSSETTPTADDILNAIKAEITKISDLGAAGAALISTATNVTALTNTAAGATVRDQSVTVSVDGTAGKAVNSVQFTHLYTQAELTTAVTTAIAGGSYSVTTLNGAPNTTTPVEKLTATIVAAINGVNGVSDVTISGLTQTGGTGNATTMVTSDVYGFNWSLTYNGATVTGTGSVTLVG